VKVAVVTLGCKVNQYDSATLESRLRAQGCEVVPFGPGADTYVINSCSVTARAEAESRRLARRARRLAPSGRVVITGCLAQANPARARIPEVDFVIGLNRLGDLVSIVRAESSAVPGPVLVTDVRKAAKVETLGADSFCGQTRAFLKVQEGCNLFCSFCIVPLARGPSRSVPPRTVLRELARLAEAGYQEVVLTGVHLGSYGRDLRPRIDLADLLEMIAEHAPVPRIRLSSVDPPELTPRLLRVVASSGTICPHFHVPIQSGDDRVLRRMRRRYSAGFAADVIEAIREHMPVAGIGTDVIAGFPHESEEEFSRTEKLIERLPFTYLHVFPYSRRPGTAAAKLEGDLPAKTIAERASRLRQIDRQKRLAFAQAMLGRCLRVLPEGAAGEEGRWKGYARNYLRVEIEAPGETIHINRELWVKAVDLGSRGVRGIPCVPGPDDKGLLCPA